MRLIDEGFLGWYKKYSALALLAIGALSSAWTVSSDFQRILGPEGLAIGNGIIAVLGFIGRFIKQVDPFISGSQDQLNEVIEPTLREHSDETVKNAVQKNSMPDKMNQESDV
jgi:hypothetical protein